MSLYAYTNFQIWNEKVKTIISNCTCLGKALKTLLKQCYAALKEFEANFPVCPELRRQWNAISTIAQRS